MHPENRLPLLLLLLSGCVCEEKPHRLPEPETRYVVLKVLDTATGRDITENGEAGNAELFLFTPEGEYAGQVSVDENRITHHTPVALPGDRPGGSRICVWTNAESGQRLHVPTDGSRIEERAISLLTDSDGYHGTPDNLFFGQLRLAQTGDGSPEEIRIFRKNARLHITVRGMDDSRPETLYYLTIGTSEDGYDFEGNPMSGPVTVREEGRFDEHGDFVTRTFGMLHSDPAATDAVAVNLYERTEARASDRLVVSVAETDDGHPISLPAGRTTNLLIDLGKGTDASVRVEITPWDEIYQWEIW